MISDWNKEPMTGMELLHEIRGSDKLKNLPFIMVSAESKTEAIAAAKQAGVSTYIVKPFNAETPRKKMASVLGPFGGVLQGATEHAAERIYPRLSRFRPFYLTGFSSNKKNFLSAGDFFLNV